MAKQNNLVAKHARKFNKAVVHKDRKRQVKRGYAKHKGLRNPYSLVNNLILGSKIIH